MLIDVDCRGDGEMHVRHRNRRANIYILEQRKMPRTCLSVKGQKR